MSLMRSDFEVILKDTLRVLFFVGMLFFVPIIVSVIYGEYYLIPAFLFTGLAICTGSYFLYSRMKTEKTTELRQALVVVALVWLFVAVLGAIPLMLVSNFGFLDAFFESMSAWTTTGLTIIPDVESLPYTILFWRSFMQWIGGMGIVVAVLAGLITGGDSLITAEGRGERIRPNIMNTIRTIWWIYALYTLVGVLVLIIAGMNVFDAVNHCMTALATGGMSTKNTSIQYFNSFPIELGCIFIMMLGAISFLTHFHVLRGNVREIPRDEQLKTMLLIMLVSFIILLPFIASARQIGFQVVSAISGTGFSTASFSQWDQFSKSVIIFLMVVGACAGSTAGGLKIIRVNIYANSIYNYLRRIITPNVVIVQRVGNHILRDSEILNVSFFIITYVLFLLAGSSLLTALGNPAIDSMFEVASAQGNVGLSTGITHAGMNPLVEIVLIVNMWVGRLEIWAALMLIGAFIIKR